MVFKPKNTQERILHRLKIAKGHLDKIVCMKENDAYCIDILHQIHAVQESLKGVGNLILEDHLRTCVTDAIKKGNSDKVVSEVMEVFNKKTI